VDTIALTFRDLAYVIIAAITGGLVAWRLGQPLIIGYVLAGVVISPLTPGPSVSNIRSLELFAEIGVVLLMFSVGLEFSLRELLKAKWIAFIGGPLGIVISILMGLGVGSQLGWMPSQGIVLGAVISVASTMVLTRLLIDQGQLRTTAGRVPEMREIALSNSALAGHTLRDMKLRETFGVTVVAIRRSSGESLTNPPADTILQPSDRLRVLGRSDQIDAFTAQFSAQDRSL